MVQEMGLGANETQWKYRTSSLNNNQQQTFASREYSGLPVRIPSPLACQARFQQQTST